MLLAVKDKASLCNDNVIVAQRKQPFSYKSATFLLFLYFCPEKKPKAADFPHSKVTDDFVLLIYSGAAVPLDNVDWVQKTASFSFKFAEKCAFLSLMIASNSFLFFAKV